MVEPPAAVEILTAGRAVPLTVRDWGEFAALSVMVSVVVRMPEASGEKMMDTAQEELAAMAPLQLSEEMLKSEALKPLRTALKIWSGALPEFVSVTF